MFKGRFEVWETGRSHGKAKNRSENPASKRTNTTGRHMALLLSTETANSNRSSPGRKEASAFMMKKSACIFTVAGGEDNPILY